MVLNTISCRKEYSSERTKDIKRKCIEYKGGVCEDCGYDKDFPAVYDFHHINGKDFTISKFSNRSFEKLKTELDKCILLCSNCHRIRHFC